MSQLPAQEVFQLAVVTAGTSDPSATRMLADRTAARVAELAKRHGHDTEVSVVDLRALATDIASALTTQLISPGLAQAVRTLGAADGIVAATPVYKAGASGLFTSFFQVLDNDLLIAKPVLLAATAGTARHALVADDQMRSAFAYLRTLITPTSLFAAPEDWRDPALNKRIERAARELVLLMESGFARQVKDEAWDSYQHEFGGAGADAGADGADDADGAGPGIDTSTDLMRLATGGSAS